MAKAAERKSADERADAAMIERVQIWWAIVYILRDFSLDRALNLSDDAIKELANKIVEVMEMKSDV